METHSLNKFLTIVALLMIVALVLYGYDLATGKIRIFFKRRSARRKMAKQWKGRSL